jgi:hypothetical protein
MSNFDLTGLLKPKENYCFNFSDMVYEVLDKYSFYLDDDAPAVYRNDSYKPVWNLNTPLYYRTSTGHHAKIESLVEFEKIQTDVFDLDKNVYFNSFIMKNKDRFLSTRPFKPYNAYRLTLLLLQNTILRNVHPLANKLSNIYLTKYNATDVIFKQEYAEKSEEHFQHILNDAAFNGVGIIGDIEDLLSKEDNAWNIWNYTFKETNLSMFKCCDSRILDWRLRVEQEEELKKSIEAGEVTKQVIYR